ncbi:MAG: amidohydrolase family protein [Thermodesulfobacteriota bacterium]|jgi:predicted TIM-barrel fold metal-dependent hydrolase|nr:MAG: amidohydrolase family protein [Thermodesulfobacteriota bacterium]
MIIDAHSHWLPEEIIRNAHFFSPAWGDIEAQVSMMDKAGIDQAVLSYPTTNAHLKMGSFNEVARIYNDAIARIVVRFPDRFIGAAILPLGNSEEMVFELRRATEQLGFRALSLASSYNGVYLDDRTVWPIFEIAQKNRIPIFVHPQIINPIGSERVNDPLLTPVIEYVFDTTISIGKLLMADIFTLFPELTLIFSNFGGIITHVANRFDETYKMLRGINFVKDLGGNPTQFLKNIYVDTGGDKTTSNFLSALELLGTQHILWGSDWPAKKDIKGSQEAVSQLPLSQNEIKNILGETINNLLKGA